MRCRNRSRVLAFALITLAGCSGGGSAPSAPPVKSPTPAPSATPGASNRTLATAVAHIIIPPKVKTASARLRRRPAWVSPSTAAIQIIATRSDGFSESTYAALNTTSGDCTSGTGGTDCNVPFQAPATGNGQTDSFAVTLLDAPVAYGSILCYGVSNGNPVTSGGVNSFTLTLGGVIGAISFATTTYTVDPGTASTVDITPTIADADNNPIAGPYDAPATVTIAGPAAADFTITTPASGSIADPLTDLNAGSIVVAYDGGGSAGSGVTLTVSSNSQLTADDIGTQATASATIAIAIP